MYRGSNAAARREQISQWDSGDLEIVEVDPARGWSHAIESLKNDTEICVFWSDDDKPVGQDFLRQMIQPLLAGEDFGAAMHFWSGNAVSVLQSVLDGVSLKDSQAGDQLLLKLIVQMLDSAHKEPHGRIHLALSSTERIAPLSMDPVGLTC
jgi:hypothetical protein